MDSSSSSTFLGDKPGDKSVDGEEAGLLLVRTRRCLRVGVVGISRG